MKTRLRIYLFFITLGVTISLTAQTYNNEWEELPNMLAEDPEQVENTSILFDQLSDLIEHPIDLNRATKEELEQLPFLSAHQIEGILSYLYIHGPLKTPYELQLIEEMDFSTITLLLPFIQILPLSSMQARKFNLRGGRSSILLRTDVPLSLKEGYKPPTSESLSESNKRYLGSSNYHFIKYEYTKNKSIQCGLTLEKDAGEQLLKGYDQYSFHLLLQKIGIFDKIALGDYRVSFGQGLVVNQGFRLGKTFSLATTNQKAKGIKRNFSTDENNYMRGAAMTLSLKRMEISFWGSYRKIDGRIVNDTIRSIITTGLHRTEKEIDYKQNISMYTIGANLLYKINTISIGITTLGYGWNKNYWIDEQYYNQNFFRGKRNGQVSIDYRWNHHQFSLFGETATSINGSIATLNGITYYPFKEWIITLLQRYYSPDYDAYFSGSFSANSRVQNENGVYIGTEFKPIKQLKVTAYADIYSFPTAKYLVDAPSNGVDLFIQGDWFLSKEHSLNFRVRNKNGEKNASSLSEQTSIQTKIQQYQYRIQHKYRPNQSLSFQSTISYNHYSHEQQRRSEGWMVSENFSYTFKKGLSINSSIAFFDTDDYFSTIYNYEPSILYGYTSRTLNGEGLRLALNLKYENINNLTFWVKYGLTYYLDRESIGSGLDRIDTPYQHEINLLVRYKF